MPDGPLSGVVIAFDIDNTLLDPTGEGYRRTVTDTLAQIDLGLSPAQAFAAFEESRANGDALERLGFANPIHDRAHPDGLAALCLTTCANRSFVTELRIGTDESEPAAALLSELAELHRRTRGGPVDSRLAAEIELRGRLREDGVARLRNVIQRLAAHAKVAAWSEAYREAAKRQPVPDHRPLFERLEQRGATPIVITEGRTTIQRAKVERLGLTDILEGRVLITETVAHVPGRAELDHRIRSMIDKYGGDAHTNDQLLSLWTYRCLMNEWSRKTPAFYATCLHAIQCHMNRPEAALADSLYLLAENWLPLRFVMIGDRYDSDVEPLIDLLGRDTGMTVRLQAGKYGHRHPLDDLPVDRRPRKTFTEWDALAQFLTDELSMEQVVPITSPPEIVPRLEVFEDPVALDRQGGPQDVRRFMRAIATIPRPSQGD